MGDSATSGSGKNSSPICGTRSGSEWSVCQFLYRNRVDPPRGPQRSTPIKAHRAESIRLGKALDREARNAGDRSQPLDAGVAIAPRCNELLQLILIQPLNLPKAETHGEAMRLTFRGRLQRAVPCAEIDIRLPHFDAMLACIAHELGRLVKTHRLAVEDGGAEDVRIVAFDPGRGIDEQREARRMALGETVLAKSFDLLEAALGEIRAYSRGASCR